MNLKEWAKIFLKQRDMIKKKILELKETNKGFLIRTKNKEEKIVLVDEKLILDEANIIICENNKKNVKKLIEEWDLFSKKEDLLIVFAEIKTNNKWLIKPYNHEKISDKKSLKQGLLSMYKASMTN